MEYRLLHESKKESNWTKTGHWLTVTNLIRGNHYRLQVRYQAHAAWMQEYTFYIEPKWYQTTQTKIIFASVLVAAALLTGLLTYKRRLNKSRRRREQLSLEIKSIRAQLNPHFIFNALASIQGLINKNDIPAANHYLTEFSTLLRESLHNHEKEMVPLVTEISLLQTYLKLEQLRFNFNYEINTDPAININATEIPNLILQPLVENAVKHGVSTLAEKGLIKIDFIKQEHDLLVSITDNGKKFDETKLADGFGLKLTRNRIALLNETLRDQPVKLTIERRQETIINLLFTNWV
jgi:two-component system LytT family sensor kinase